MSGNPGSRRSRYPGVRPFSDSREDQDRFFGRDAEAEQLYLRVLSVPLFLQFSKSGLGKTSLLQAALFPRLRQRAYLPLMIRLNATTDSFVDVLLRSMRQACEAEKLIFAPGDTSGAWELLTTTTVWRGDLLLTPVLVFDQFEEVFTLRDSEFRNALALEIGALASGVPPARLRRGTSSGSPVAKVVISLREDYLGELEELSGAIPTLFLERLRLEPFGEDAARQAIVGPARLESREGDDAYSPPFEIETAALDSMLDFLKGDSGVIEPLHLQLMCRHAEEIASRKSAGVVTLTVDDFAGAQRFTAVLESFYRNTLMNIASPAQRKRAALLCEDGLISETGHRLMLEKSQILRQYRLTLDTLDTLCRHRLLIREQRAESVFYEISHDRLAKSIFDSRRFKLPRRVRRGLAAATLALLLIIAVLIAYNQRIDSARSEVQKERDSADQLIGFLLGQRFLGEIRDTGRSALLSLVQSQIDKSGAAKRNALNSALAWRNTGDIAVINGHSAEAIEHYRKAVRLLAESDADPQKIRELARTRRQIANLLDGQGHPKESLDEFQRAIQEWRQILAMGVKAAETKDCVDLANALISVANVKLRMGNGNVGGELDEAFTLVSNVIFSDAAPCGTAPEMATPHPDADAVGALSRIALTRGWAYEFTEDSAGAAALAVESSLLQPQSVSAREFVLGALRSHGDTVLPERPDDALKDYREMERIAGELQRWDPNNRGWQRTRSQILLLISGAFVECHKRPKNKPCQSSFDLRDAEAMTLEAIAQLRALAAIDSTHIGPRGDLIWALTLYASIRKEQGRPPAESLALLREAQRLYHDLPLDPSDVMGAIYHADLLRNLSSWFFLAGDVPESTANLREAKTIMLGLSKAHPDRTMIVVGLRSVYRTEAELLRKQGQADGAAAADREIQKLTSQYLSIGYSGQERERLAASINEHLLNGYRLLGTDPAAALPELDKADDDARQYIRYRPAGFQGYEMLSLVESLRFQVPTLLEHGPAQGVALMREMHAAQLAVWLSRDAPPQESKQIKERLLIARVNFAVYLGREGRKREALSMAQEAIIGGERLVRDSSVDPELLGMLGVGQCDLGQIRRDLGMEGWEEAVRSGLIRIENASAMTPTDVVLLSDINRWHEYLATELEASGRADDARKERERASKAYDALNRLAPTDLKAQLALRRLQK